MKKTLILLLATASVACASFEYGKVMAVTFGTNGGKNITTSQGSLLGVADQTYNIISTAASGSSNFTQLSYADGTEATGMKITVGKPVSGEGGRVTTILDSDAITSTFDLSKLSGTVNDQGGCSITVDGLVAGRQYTVYVFGGRGNTYGGSDYTTYSISSGGEYQTGSILGYRVENGLTAPVVNPNGSITAMTQSTNSTAQSCNNWALMEFTFMATGTSATLNADGACGNIAALAITVPEPATATLSLLALAGLAARRRR